jgi:hypothetical protein
VVRALMSLRGLALLNAATLAAELGDLHRFATARQLMGYLGLVPSEDSTGDQRPQGGITKMGNGYARRALIEAAWNYRVPARLSRALLKRQEGVSQEVQDIAWAAQTRLHYRYRHWIGPARKKAPVAAAALGRELSGFVWAIGRLVQPRPPKSPAPPAGGQAPPEVVKGQPRPPKNPTPPQPVNLSGPHYRACGQPAGQPPPAPANPPGGPTPTSLAPLGSVSWTGFPRRKPRQSAGQSRNREHRETQIEPRKRPTMTEPARLF